MTYNVNKSALSSFSNFFFISDVTFKSTYLPLWNIQLPNIYFLILTFCVSVAYLWHKSRRNLPPGPFAWPIFGNLHFFKSKSHISLANLRDEYGDIFSIRTGSYNTVIVCSLNGVLEGLTGHEGILDGRPDMPVFHSLFRGDKQRGIQIADLDVKTCIKRKYVMDCLDSYCSKPNDIETIITKEILSLMCYFLKEQGPFNPAESFRFAHLHIMMTLIFDDAYNPDDPITRDVYECLEDRVSAMKVEMYNYLHFLKPLYQEKLQQMDEKTLLLTKYLRLMLNQHKDSYDPSHLRDMVDQLLFFIEEGEDKELLDSDDMDYLLLELSGCGFASVPALLTWLLGYMAAFPAVQLRVQQEMDTVIGRSRFPTVSDQTSLPYTMAVILEVQRIVTIHPFLYPHRAVKNCKFQGYDIPKNTIFLFSAWSIHHDKCYWKNPSKFDPTRFLDLSGQLEIPDYFLPFGLGERRCPGESFVEIEVYLFFTFIIHQFMIKPQGMNFHLQPEYNYIVKPKSFYVEIMPREDDDL